jgi:hypothetical protein
MLIGKPERKIPLGDIGLNGKIILMVLKRVFVGYI